MTERMTKVQSPEEGLQEGEQPPPEEHPIMLHADADSVSSSGSSSSWLEVRFQQQGDAKRFVEFLRLCILFAAIHTVSAATSFFSSLYPVQPGAPARHSAVDAFLASSNIMAIDISSAFFVVTGFFCAFTVANINSADIKTLYKIVLLNTLLDAWLATLLSIVFGSLFHLMRHAFAVHDIALTALEGFTCLRTLELRQDPTAMHSLNPSAWPVMCVLYAFLLTPWTMSSNNRLHGCYPSAGLFLLLVNALVPIVTISLFALLHEDTNIFFINSTHFGYRLLEYNIGICFFMCVQKYPVICTKFTYAVTCLYPLVTVIFLLLWWAQLGTPVAPSYGTCIRMYYFSPCVQMHHGFLMRGCFLGITLLCKITLSQQQTQDTILHNEVLHSTGIWLASSVSSVLFIWPACYILHIILEINFSLTLVHENATLLVVLVPVITFMLSWLWNHTWKIPIVSAIEKGVDRAYVSCTRPKHDEQVIV